jgi:hypothetical protein
MDLRDFVIHSMLEGRTVYQYRGRSNLSLWAMDGSTIAVWKLKSLK